ncbi:MAG: hypothetical protein KDA61_02270, partial [Planctomycetales bacterium]|nr:hypothetical protein [Planctomycetales bacterium]
ESASSRWKRRREPELRAARRAWIRHSRPSFTGRASSGGEGEWAWGDPAKIPPNGGSGKYNGERIRIAPMTFAPPLCSPSFAV